jgi:hypothetical protein
MSRVVEKRLVRSPAQVVTTRITRRYSRSVTAATAPRGRRCSVSPSSSGSTQWWPSASFSSSVVLAPFTFVIELRLPLLSSLPARWLAALPIRTSLCHLPLQAAWNGTGASDAPCAPPVIVGCCILCSSVIVGCCIPLFNPLLGWWLCLFPTDSSKYQSCAWL